MQPTSQKSLAIQKQYALSAQQMYDAADCISQYHIVKVPSGNFQVRSKSRPNQFHMINPREESCTCEAASKGNMCFHLAAWVYLNGLHRRELENYCASVNLSGSMLPLNVITDPIARRELAQKQQRAAQKKTEWVEEID